MFSKAGPMDLPLQTSEVARLIERSPERVRQLANAGLLPFRSTARGIRLFERADVENFIRRRSGRRPWIGSAKG